MAAASDTRTPLELLDEIEARGHEVDAAVVRRRSWPTIADASLRQHRVVAPRALEALDTDG